MLSTVWFITFEVKWDRRTSDYLTSYRLHAVLQEEACSYFTPYRLQAILQESQWICYTLQATHRTTAELVTILHPSGDTWYYRRSSDNFSLWRLHIVLQQRASVDCRRDIALTGSMVMDRGVSLGVQMQQKPEELYSVKRPVYILLQSIMYSHSLFSCWKFWCAAGLKPPYP